MNRLVVAARGTWGVPLNPDSSADLGWLEAAANALYADPSLTMMASLQLDAENPNLLDGAGGGYSICGPAWRVDHGHAFEGYPFSGGLLLPCGAAAAYCRDRIMKVGAFCERFFCYFEDVDLGLRLAMTGNRSKPRR